MNLQSLLVCSDEQRIRLLRTVLRELEIEVEHCLDRVQASHKLAQKHFEAVIIDCDHPDDFSLLQGVRSQQENRNSLAVAIIDANSNAQAAFAKGANIVVYKPISIQKTKSSFRAARALMQRERRRSARLPTNIPADFRFEDGVGAQATISGLSEDGVSVRFSGWAGRKTGVIGFCFDLPDTTVMIAATGTVAWQDSRHHAGIQFAAISESSRRSLKQWLRAQSGEKPDPIRCTLAALSFGACFLQTESAFPVQTRVELVMHAADRSFRTEGKVRFMDPELGMGIEFISRSQEHLRQLEQLIERISSNPETVTEVLVEPEGLDWGDVDDPQSDKAPPSADQNNQEDGLMKLLERAANLPREQFRIALEKHKLVPTPTGESTRNLIAAHRRRVPRMAVSHSVQVWVQDGFHESERHTASMIDVSHHGARIETTLGLAPGDRVRLASGIQNGRFRVVWVGLPGTPQEGQAGLQKIDD